MNRHPVRGAKVAGQGQGAKSQGSKVIRPSLLVAVAALTALLVGCGTTPEPTEPPPTQTPWIIIVTATPAPEEAARVQPTQTPWIIIATPTAAVRPQATSPQASPTATTRATQATATPTQKPSAATNTPAVADLKYPPPALLDPPNDRPVSWNNTVLLRWSSVGKLAEDEYYHLHLERRPKTEGESWYGDYVYTKETQYLAERAFLAPFHLSVEHGQAVVYWWVRVVRKTGEDQNGKPTGIDVSGASEERTLVLDPKP